MSDYLYDCVISAGQLDRPGGYRLLGNNLRTVDVPLKGVTYQEFKEWLSSPSRYERVKELNDRAIKVLGRVKWAREYHICCFCTMHKD